MPAKADEYLINSRNPSSQADKKMPLSKSQRIKRIVSRIDEVFPSSKVNWLGACKEERIQRVESKLKVTLPESYKEFVRLKGGGGFENFFIFGISPKGSLNDGGVIGYFANYFREDWVGVPLPLHLIPVQHDRDLMVPFCLDTSRIRRGECPVVAYALSQGETEDVESDFVTFYEVYLKPYF